MRTGRWRAWLSNYHKADWHQSCLSKRRWSTFGVQNHSYECGNFVETGGAVQIYSNDACIACAPTGQNKFRRSPGKSQEGEKENPSILHWTYFQGQEAWFSLGAFEPIFDLKPRIGILNKLIVRKEMAPVFLVPGPENKKSLVKPAVDTIRADNQRPGILN